SGQKRRVTPQIKREFKRRAAIEPVIGHLKEHHRMGRNHLAHASGDAINAVLAAAGYNFRRLLAWLRLLLLRILIAFSLTTQPKIRLKSGSSRPTNSSIEKAQVMHWPRPSARRPLVSSTRPAARAAGETRFLLHAAPWPGQASPRRRPSGARSRR